jgi:acetyl-CoA carboxylase biotin carboxyl carrier protein
MEKLKMDHILKIMEQFEKTSIDTLQYKNDGEEILLTKSKNGTHASFNSDQEDVSQLKEMARSKNGSSQETQEETEKTEVSQQAKEVENQDTDDNLIKVESPIIGTFYRSPAPGKPAFINKGDTIKEGDVLCIVEAMKVMNKIEAEVSGEVVEICLEDGSSVEYGTCLFKIKP